MTFSFPTISFSQGKASSALPFRHRVTRSSAQVLPEPRLCTRKTINAPANAPVVKARPAFTNERRKYQAVYRHPQDCEHLLDGLRKAGLPEH